MNHVNTEEEIKILDLQIFLSSIFILTILFSIFSTYNEKYNLKYGKRIIEADIIAKLTKINRIIGLIILFGFLYINYKTREFDELRDRSTRPDDLSIISSYFSITAGIITLYIVFIYGEEALISGENPEN